MWQATPLWAQDEQEALQPALATGTAGCTQHMPVGRHSTHHMQCGSTLSHLVGNGDGQACIAANDGAHGVHALHHAHQPLAAAPWGHYLDPLPDHKGAGDELHAGRPELSARRSEPLHIRIGYM